MFIVLFSRELMKIEDSEKMR